MAKEQKQAPKLFEGDSAVEMKWEDSWREMPDFSQEDMAPIQQIIVSFKTREDVKRFGELMGQNTTYKTKSMWFPKQTHEMPGNFCWSTKGRPQPRYPIYIISKGRWESRLTAKALLAMGVDFKIVVEPKEYEHYAAVIDPKFILQLPGNFSERHEGGIPARNWVWEHAIASGAERHWIMDDNIDGFTRLTNNQRIDVDNAAIFQAIEDFVDRYENVPMAGMNYIYLANEKVVKTPYTLNTRIYSCILLSNKIEHRWRGKYNEDTDLSLRILKDGHCTLLFNTFLCNKITTLKMKGGNTDTVYATGDKRLEFAESLVRQHPDVARVVWRYDRWHHQVDYSHFMKNNKLKLKEGVNHTKTINEYGMEFIRRKKESNESDGSTKD